MVCIYQNLELKDHLSIKGYFMNSLPRDIQELNPLKRSKPSL